MSGGTSGQAGVTDRLVSQRPFLWAACVGGAYFLAHIVSFVFPDSEKVLMAVWPASGVGLAALLLSPRRAWPLLALVLYLSGNAADLVAGRPVIGSLGFMTANVLESLGGAWLIRRACGERIVFNRVNDVLALMAVVALVNTATALLGAAAAESVSSDSFWSFYETWWIADGLGIILITPVLISWLTPQPGGTSRSAVFVAEATGFLLLWYALSWLAFNPERYPGLSVPPPYFLVALLAWSALRFGTPVTTLAAVTLAFVVVASASVTDGPLLWGGADHQHRLLYAQLFVGVMGTTGLLMSASYMQTRRAEELARNAHGRIRALEDNIPNGLVFQVARTPDGATRVLHVSAGLERIIGVSTSEAMRDPGFLYALALEEDRAALAAAERASLDNLSNINQVVRIRRPDGQMRWTNISASPRRSNNGDIIWDGLQIDITDLKRAEAETQDLYNNAPCGYHSVDANGVIVRINDTELAWLGYHRDDVIGKLRVPDVLTEESRTVYNEYFARLIALGRIRDIELDMVCKDGSIRSVLLGATSIRDEQGRFLMSRATAFDITDRKRAEALRRESESRFRTAADAAPVLLWQTGADGLCDYLNLPWLSFTGRPLEHELGNGWTESIHPGDFDRFQRTYLAAFKDRHEFSAEYRLRRADGEYRWMLHSAVPRFTPDGAFVGYIGSCLDITEHKNAEDALCERDARMTEILENALDASYKRNLQTNTYEYVSPVFEQITGYNLSEMQNFPVGAILDLIHPEDRPDVDEVMAASLSNNSNASFRVEFRFKLKSGIYRWFRNKFTVVRDEHNTPLAYIGSVADINDQKEANFAFTALAARNQTLLQTAQEGIHILDSDGNVTEVNPAFCAMLGYTHDELMSMNVADWDVRWTNAELREQLTGLFNQPALFETRHRRKDGRILDVEISAVGLFLNGQQHLYAAVRDITERKLAETEKQGIEAQNRQMQKTESLGRMAGAIAHNFNNQLLVVIGNLDLALGDTPEDWESREFLVRSMQAAVRASEISGQMLTYLGQTYADKTPLDLAEVCRRKQSMLQASMTIQTALEFDFPAPGPLIAANENQMQQLLVNLFANAWEACDSAACKVRVSVKTAFATDIDEVHRFPIDYDVRAAEFACLEVSDSGHGIREPDIEKLFDPFFTTKFTGRGLGLAVAIGIVRAHEGVITVHSDPRSGSVFRVYFPLLVPAARTAAANAAAVLVVEDEESVRRVVTVILQRLGYTAIAAQDGQEAIELYRRHADSICCVLCDLSMPGMDGWMTLNALRAISPNVPVVLASGYSEEQVMHGVHAELPQGFIRKPYRATTLREVILKALGAEATA